MGRLNKLNLVEFLKEEREHLRLVAARTKLAEGDLRDIVEGRAEITDEVEAKLTALLKTI